MNPSSIPSSSTSANPDFTLTPHEPSASSNPKAPTSSNPKKTIAQVSDRPRNNTYPQFLERTNDVPRKKESMFKLPNFAAGAEQGLKRLFTVNESESEEKRAANNRARDYIKKALEVTSTPPQKPTTGSTEEEEIGDPAREETKGDKIKQHEKARGILERVLKVASETPTNPATTPDLTDSDDED